MGRVAVTGAVEVKPWFRPAGPAGVADAAFETCRRAPSAFLALSLLVNVPLFASVAGLHVFVRERGVTWGSFSYFAILAVLSIAVAAAMWLRAVGTGALAHASVSAISRGEASAARSMRAALTAGASLGAISAFRLAAILAGAVACGLPAAIVYGAFALAPHVAVLEGLSVSQSFVRSARLAPRAAAGIFASTLLAVLVLVIGFVEILLFAQLAVVLAGAVAPSVPTGWLARPETAWVALAITKIIADPLVSAASTLAWIDARIRGEGLDLELRSQLVAGERLSIEPETAT